MRATLLKLLAVITVFGAVYASAASLGGITSSQLGADDAVVGSCDTDGVTTSYTSAWDSTDTRYEVTGVTVGGINNACDGQTLKVTLTDGTNAVGTGTLTVPSDGAVTSHSVTLGTAASASAVTGVNVTIS